jgi:hypothetical protein
MDHDIQWWLSHLQGVQKTSTGWVALCPAHEDRKRSLSITPSGRDVLVNCFAGCEYSRILESISSGEPSLKITKVPTPTPQLSSDQTAEWWESYTGVPREEWESWGVVFSKSQLNFTWKTTKMVKVRKYLKKEFTWAGSGPTPPLWPEAEESLPSTLWLSEGESDFGVLRHLGFPAYSITRGASTRLSPAVWDELKARGVATVVLVFDEDSAGSEATEKYTEDIVASRLRAVHVSLRSLLNPLVGEKDIRDLYRRLGDPLKEVLEDLVQRADGSLARIRRVGVEQFLKMAIPETSWLVQDVWLAQSTGMIVGPPKSGKSWLALDMGISVATGRSFLGTYEVESPGPVAVITSEDPDPLLQDRLEKILIAKGLGGSVDYPLVTFPRDRRIPLYLDLERTFVFSDEGTRNLLLWLDQIYEIHGRLSLVIFDPVLRFLPPGIDEYKVSEVSSAVFKTSSIIYKKYGAAVQLIHHKSKGESEGKKSYGSVAFGAFSESALYLSPTTEGVTDWVNVLGDYKSAEQTHWSYRFNNLKDSYQVEVSGEPQIKRSTVLKDIQRPLLELLSEYSKGLTVKEMTSELEGSSEYIIRTALKSLKSQKLVNEIPSTSIGKGPRSDHWVIVTPVSG